LTKNQIPFNKPYLSGMELNYIRQAHENGQLAGDGTYTKLCSNNLEKIIGCNKALLTHSCTAALELAALVLDLQPDDEVIMPSYTFVSTANAFVLRGAIPVFVDVRADTLNINETLIEEAITSKTRAIVPVHYAGVSCEMDTINAIAKKYELAVIEDAAQAILSTYKNRALGSIGDLGALSFHETKNIISGEGGALLINQNRFEVPAEIMREKGTNRTQFFNGAIDKYTWIDKGSSLLPGELIAAFLWAQLQNAQEITSKRLTSWDEYHHLLQPLEEEGILRRPIIPTECKHNGHIYYVILNDKYERQKVLLRLRDHGINAVFHYIPLHSSPGGIKYGSKDLKSLPVTDWASKQLIRLPIWVGISQQEIAAVVKCLRETLQDL